METCTINTIPVPFSLTFISPTHGDIGRLYEKDSTLAFEGNVGESGAIFVDFILKSFNANVELLSALREVNNIDGTIPAHIWDERL